MNLHIGELAKHPRGKKWRSRLIPFDADIRRMREEGVSYKAIAAWISEQGLQISGSAVHAYVRVRARRGQSEYRLPVAQCPNAAMCASANQNLLKPHVNYMRSVDHAPASPFKEFVYTDQSKEYGPLEDKDLSFNDPLAIPATTHIT